MDTWSQTDFGSSDVMVIQVWTDGGKVLIVNTYSDNVRHEAMKRVVQVMRSTVLERQATDPGCHLIWLGDFNLHHPMWDESRNSHLFTRSNLDKAQYLIDTMADMDLQMALPRGHPTLQVMSTGNYTRPDNVFISSSLNEVVAECNTVPVG